MQGKEKEFGKNDLDRFQPLADKTGATRSSAKRIAFFMFMGAAGIFILVMGAILTSEQTITGGTAPEALVQRPSTAGGKIIPPIELRQPDPEPEEDTSAAVPQPQQQTRPQIIFVPQPQQQPQVRRAVVPAYGRMPWISQARRTAHENRMNAASATTSVGGFGANSAPNAMANVDAVDSAMAGGSESLSSGMSMGMDTEGGSSSTNISAVDPNGWGRKDAFRNQPKPAEYSQNSVSEPISRLEVKAGTIIPCVLISGLNSDLPGNAVGQVSENVWDTVTGRYLLIPRGTRVIGNYDNQIAYGQNRALIVWNRIIFPDGTSLILDNLNASDQAGYAGLKGQVNKHLGSLLTSALLVSLIGAGVELAQPNRNNNNNNNNNNNRNVGDILSSRVATAIGEVMTQIIQRELQRQPTIRIKPGARFVMMVQRDMIFPKTWNR